MISLDRAAGPEFCSDVKLETKEPFVVEARHPHWRGTLHLDPLSKRARLSVNGSQATYALLDDELELAWDNHPAERFRLENGRYVHPDLIGISQDESSFETAEHFFAQVPHSNFSVHLRKQGSDVDVYAQVFIHNEYDTKHLPRSASVIVDLGANIGMASLFFASRYPSASIIAVEPDPDNFALLKHNIAQIGGKAVAVQAAIWGAEQDLEIKRTDAAGAPLGDWGVQVDCAGAASDHTVMGWSMGRLIRHFGLTTIDILKIDVEGAEKELFEASDLSWLSIVDMILIETHERFRPGCEAAVLKLLERGFMLAPRSGENEVFIRKAAKLHSTSQHNSVLKPVIITAYYREDRKTLERCIKSVRDQSVGVDHILIADGHPQAWIDDMPVRHIKLDSAHGDYGNTPRGVGSLLAISEGYDGIGYLDADNWLDTDHVASCIAAQETAPDADFVIARWSLRRPDGSILPSPYDPSHVDTNCFFFLAGSFYMLPHFSMMHKELSLIGDRVFYTAIKGAGLKSVVVEHPTVNYTCLWPLSYKLAGEEPPPEAKQDINSSHLDGWLKSHSPRDLDIISRRAGVRFV